jgi:hypothetical protein
VKQKKRKINKFSVVTINRQTGFRNTHMVTKRGSVCLVLGGWDVSWGFERVFPGEFLEVSVRTNKIYL